VSLASSDAEQVATFESPGLIARYATPTGLVLPEGIDFEEWTAVGEVLRQMEHSVMWWLGDWWRYGERAYGEASSQAAPSGYSLATVQNAAWVADRVEPFRRLKGLSWGHHQAVAALESTEADRLLDKAGADGWSVRDLRQEVRRQKNAIGSGVRYGQRHDDPVPDAFSVLVIDPPWQYDNKATRAAAEDHYTTLSIAQLTGVDPTPYEGESINFAETVRGMADENCHLYLWVTNGFLREGFELIESWGFTYKACLTWVKPQIGIGNYFRNNTEHVLFGMKGRLPTLSNSQPTAFTADRTRHSAKPGAFYDLVEASSPGPYMELFSRTRRINWYAWGDQA